MRKYFRLDVRINPSTILEHQPLCVTLRLISTEPGATRFTVCSLRDRWNRQHCPTVMLMDDSFNQDQLRLMYNSEYAPHPALTKTTEWLHFTDVVKYPFHIVEKSQMLFESIVDQIVQFLTKGMLNGKPYPGFTPY